MDYIGGKVIVKGWKSFLGQFQKDLKLWFLCVFYLALFRLVFIFVFRDKISEGSGLASIIYVLFSGFRFDSMVAAYFVVLPFLGSVLSGLIHFEKVADRIRNAISSLYIVLTVILSMVTFEYFREFDDQFNHFLFNFYYDDTKAILKTAWSDYHAALNIAGMAAIILISHPLKRMYFRKSFLSDKLLLLDKHSTLYRLAIVMLIPFLFFTGLRGSVGRRPMQRHDAAVTSDGFLNKAVFNPYIALKYAVYDFREISSSSGIEVFIPDGNILEAARIVFKVENPKDLDEAMAKRAGGTKNDPARHVFVIVMESYDTWALLDKYSSLGLTNSLKRLSREGVFVKNFLPASWGTMTSFSALMTGLPEAGVFTNYQRSATKAYPSSVARAFKELGYRTRFFYGGYLSWQRVEGFVRAQGFDEVYGAPDIAGWITTNEWGVSDEYLFKFIEGKATDDMPSFNMILSTGYHPPYNIDVYKKGFKLREVPEDIKPIFDNKNVNLKTLGHLWYADWSLGNFVEAMEKKLPMAVFAITGDHSGRKHISTKPDMFERSAVPLVLYGKDVLNGISLPPGAAGSHIDIGPTLIELAAPSGFRYYSIGADLLKPRDKYIGIGAGKAIGGDYLTDFSVFYNVTGHELPDRLPDIEGLRKYHNSVLAVSWWRIMKGPEIYSK